MGTSAAGSGIAVTGRACTIANVPPARAHSTSCGAPKCCWMRAPIAASSAADASSSTGSRRRPSGTGRSVVPAPVATVMTSLPAVVRVTTRPVAVSTARSSVVTVPETTDSPRPHAALMAVRSRRPVVGSAVNITPAASASTISCTTTASATSEGSMPRRAR